MAKYIVYAQQVVSTSVEVEADSPGEAIEAVFLNGFPHLMFGDHTYPDEGEWGSPSELFPKFNKPEDDVQLIGGES